MDRRGVQLKTTKKIAYAIVLLMIVVGLIDTRLYPLLYIPIIFILIKHNKKLYPVDDSIKMADIGIILISVYETVSVFLPGHFGISHQIESIQRILHVCVFWCFYRLVINERKQIDYITNSLSIVAGIISLLTIVAYIKHKQFVVDLGQDDMISFRSFYKPLGFISNDWVAILLCSLPMTVVSIINSTTKKQLIIYSLTYYLVVVSILVSFSRGAYLSLLFFVFMLIILGCYFKCDYRKRVCIMSSLIIILACVTIFSERKFVISTCQMSKTTVQRQSIQGRISKWGESMSLYKLTPISGVGSGNYSVAYDFFVQEKRSLKTRRSTNTYLQMLVEKGLVGSMIIIISLFLIIYDCVKAVIKDKRKLPFLLAVLAVFLREFFFSSFYEERRIPLLCMLLVLLIIQKPLSDEKT